MRISFSLKGGEIYNMEHMRHLENNHYTGERALFKISDTSLRNCLFDDGESPLKECSNLLITHSAFGYKYPLWYGKNHYVKDTTFLEEERAGVWYTDGSVFESCQIFGEKNFRKCRNLTLRNILFQNASETLWWNDGLTLDNIEAKGDYFGMASKNVSIRNLRLEGNYAFDGCENLAIYDSLLHTKDAFWNCKNILLENCVIEGEYFGWNSQNVTLRNCKIISHQGFCYMKNITLENCETPDSDLAFEYCENINATIKGSLLSLKNPISGKLVIEQLGQYIQDDPSLDFSKTTVESKR